MTQRRSTTLMAATIMLLISTSCRKGPVPAADAFSLLRASLAAEAAIADESVRGLIARGEAAMPDLRLLLEDSDPLVRSRARRAVGLLTGQWGDGGGLRWKRSLEDALNQEKPILLLQLFGRFDEEFC